MASTYLSRTFGSGNQQIFTVSAWVKFSDDDEQNYIFSTGADSENRLIFLRHNSSNDSRLLVDAKTTSSQTIQVRPNRAFRDTSAWYHIVLSVDTTQATASDRVKIYVNGVQETSFAQSTYPSQNYNTEVNKAATHYIGKTNSGSTYYNGSMAHYHFIDGTAYDASAFGETDSTTGIWKPKTAPSVTYGTNGFFLKFENSGAFGTDSSGNGNTFTVNGTMTQTIDTPSNVFATFNSLAKGIDGTLSEGNLSIDYGSASSRTGQPATLGVSQGKWYWEVKASASSSGDNYVIGIVGTQYNSSTTASYSIGYYPGYTGQGYGYFAFNGNVLKSDSAVVTLNTYTTGDIIGIALDLDNDDLYFYKNGTIQNGGTAIDISSVTPDYGVWFPAVGDGASTNTCTLDANFGNGYFGTTAVSSAQNPDDGIGIFEYDVPAGYRALCTKSINAQEYS